MKCKTCEHYHIYKLIHEGLFRAAPCLDCKRWVKKDNYTPIEPKEVGNREDNAKQFVDKHRRHHEKSHCY